MSEKNERQEQTSETLLAAQLYPNRRYDGGDPGPARLLAQREASVELR